MYNNYLGNIGIQLFIQGSKLRLVKSQFLEFIILDSISLSHSSTFLNSSSEFVLFEIFPDLLFVSFGAAATSLFLFETTLCFFYLLYGDELSESLLDESLSESLESELSLSDSSISFSLSSFEEY